MHSFSSTCPNVFSQGLPLRVLRGPPVFFADGLCRTLCLPHCHFLGAVFPPLFFFTRFIEPVGPVFL